MLRSASLGVVVLADLITYNQSASLGLSVPVEGPTERRGALDGFARGHRLNEITNALARSLDQLCARVVNRLSRGYLDGSQPTAVGVPVKVVTRLDGMVHLLGIPIVSNRSAFCVQNHRGREDQGKGRPTKYRHRDPYRAR